MRDTGAMLPCPEVLWESAAPSGLEAMDSAAFGESYAQTLSAWRCQFNDPRNTIVAPGFDERFHPSWNCFLAASAAGFASRATDVLHIACRRPS